MIGRLNHVAIVVPDLKAATDIYRNALGADVSEPVEVPEHGVTTVFVTLPNTKIEFLHPLGENSPIAGFLAKNPSGGMHHVCYEVKDILAARDHLVKSGARVIGDQALRPHLLFKVLDFLSAGQHASLLRIGRVEGDGELADRVPSRGHDDLAMGELAAVGQGFFQVGRGVNALQPIVHQGLEARVVQAQQVTQAREGLVGVLDAALGQAVEGQLGRRRVLLERPHGFHPTDFERGQALTQGGLQRVFPPVFDVHAGPQPLQAVEAVLGQPGLELAFGLHFVLQGTQGLEAGAEFGQASRLRLAVGLGRLAGVIERGHRLGQLAQAGLDEALLFLTRLVLAAQIGQAQLVGGGQGLHLGAQALAALLDLARLFVEVARLGGQKLDLLLHLPRHLALIVGSLGGRAHGVFERRHVAGQLFGLRRQDLGLLLTGGHLLGQLFELDLGATVQLSVDSDINRTMRMPFPVRQRTTTASLRITPGPSTTLILGAERRSMAGESLIRGGATLFVNGRTWHIGAGFQASQDRPMKGAALSVF